MQSVREQREYSVAMRRYFHRYPELSWKEFNTAGKIREELARMGLPYTEVSETGTIATLRGNSDAPVIGLRCDIDALPIREVKDLEFRSENDGVMHACGHDAHIAMLLTAAKVLSAHRDLLNCTVKLIFQPAEEVVTGALSMLASGELDDVDRICGMHIFPFLEHGTISVDAGPRYTSSDTMKIRIIGKSGHGAMPHHAVDPIYVGAKVVDALQSIASREVDPRETVVVSVCTFHSGSLSNIFDQTAELSGTVRTFNPELREKLPEMIERVVANTVKAYRADYEFEYSMGVPATINDEACSRIAERSVRAILGDEGLVTLPGTPGGEDFSFYMEKIPGVYAFVGCRNEAKDCIYSLHHERFDLDEDSMMAGAAFYVRFVLDMQENIGE
jgi:amidohydrolase